MCGIFGFVTDKRDWSTKHRLLTHLAIETQVRGQHATGVAWSDGRHARYFKRGIKASDFVRLERFQRIKHSKPYMVIGHDRFATHGAPADNANNHPFKSHKAYFIHNGVIRNYDQLKREYPCASECDSEVILRVLESKPRKLDGIQEVYKQVRGSFACALLDWQHLRLHLWRNYGNPIVVRYNAKLNLFVFASTSHILQEACKQADVLEGWKTVPLPLADDYILTVRFRRDDRRILRATQEVECKQIDPTVVQTWSNADLARYANGNVYDVMKQRADNEVRPRKRGNTRGGFARDIDRYAEQSKYRDPSKKYKGYYDGQGNLIIDRG